MNQDVVSLSEGTPVAEAIATLDDYHISGTPVINDLGECVGVFTSNDVLKLRREIGEGEAPGSSQYFHADPLSEEPDESFVREDYDLNLLGEERVGQWMTSEVKWVSPDTKIEEVCRRMAKERIHRLLVMENRKVLGIISSFDIVRFVAGLKE
jgi:CBS domain-containing protein